MCICSPGMWSTFKYLMKRLGYVFKKDAWMEVQAPGFRYYHKLAKLDEMFFRRYVTALCGYALDGKALPFIRRISGDYTGRSCHHSRRRFYPKLYRLRVVEQKRFCSWRSKVCRGFEEVSSVTG